mmetsp:Transcript_26331/g.41646  ORF Transcript_26331/g.41646 Transcript_26331/m.41646 type:complete len:326 (+) Transcript_26331:563-1540(+)
MLGLMLLLLGVQRAPRSRRLSAPGKRLRLVTGFSIGRGILMLFVVSRRLRIVKRSGSSSVEIVSIWGGRIIRGISETGWAELSVLMVEVVVVGICVRHRRRLVLDRSSHRVRLLIEGLGHILPLLLIEVSLREVLLHAVPLLLVPSLDFIVLVETTLLLASALCVTVARLRSCVKFLTVFHSLQALRSLVGLTLIHTITLVRDSGIIDTPISLLLCKLSSVLGVEGSRTGVVHLGSWTVLVVHGERVSGIAARHAILRMHRSTVSAMGRIHHRLLSDCSAGGLVSLHRYRRLSCSCGGRVFGGLSGGLALHGSRNLVCLKGFGRR